MTDEPKNRGPMVISVIVISVLIIAYILATATP